MLAKLIATFALVLTAACDTNLLVSTTDSFTVISPANSIAVIEPWFAIYRPSMIAIAALYVTDFILCKLH